ncbi:hypothetical protein BWI97_12910 [Siphonobacter sp. BAB-5405]|uniref:hypothetical protein n=1 Tax=Siphonobacter sp. BAB-5405 TaxID=1864825 RepID=UPI000C7F8554|nr:hypothetical protein [Siphonobacter sp. BAB-5405]PMD96187.1 hypothetical protein BWI97_12910 [Siphonobacter sp. BAB-5405]
MKKLLLKSLYALAALRYPTIKKKYLLYFIRDNYYCKLVQTKFVLKDYVEKKPYKVIQYRGEFDQELRYVLPFAYWHHLNGTLEKTISASNTKEFYFFSPNHEERYKERIWTESYDHYDVPNMTHSNSYSFQKWAQVPFREHYKNDLFVYDKPILLIANKYNREWDQPPINFLGIAELERIIHLCRDKFQIVYNRPLPTQIVQDNSETLDLGEHAWLRENHPEVIQMNDLYRQQYPEKVTSYNHLQLMVYANTQHFISMHGGTAALASCFGGSNIILSNPNWGMEHAFNEYENLFPKLSGAQILHAREKPEIFQFIEREWLK